MTYLVNVISTFMLVVSFTIFANGEVYTSTHEMEYLLETQQRVVEELDDYIIKEEQRLNTLKRYLDIFKREQKKAMKDPVNYVSNPINAFTLIKRLIYDLKEIENNIKIGTDYLSNITLTHHDAIYPTQEDLRGAAVALSRLQQTYELETDDLAEGKLKGVTYSASLSAGDCYELGKALYMEQFYKDALKWMNVALHKYKLEQIHYDFTEENIFDNIAYTNYLLGDMKGALEWTKKLLKVNPNNKRARGNIPHYHRLIAEQEEALKHHRHGDTEQESIEEIDEMKEKSLFAYDFDWNTYEKLCRGEIKLLPDMAKKLTCQYLTGEHPFLRYAAIKMEYLYRDPDIVMYYDVLSDNEIDIIKQLATPNFHRAVVLDIENSESKAVYYRISKSAWLHDDESPTIARVSRRVSHFTNLDMSSAEELQVVNYGIGGHYTPHYDYYRPNEESFKDKAGDRIATVLFYMSDVAQGGATVFVDIGVSVFPVKGAALVWMNLHRSGEGDLATRHAACPVLLGSKWACNKWIHEIGQEFLRPCDLEYQSKEMHLKLPKNVATSIS
ncbi:prolyl 4-hydroxylase subunit alpha-1-like isoform X13 [Leptidea sinapis]|uniref:prolyl 4-hydroxylase subunit alpha-1-like isoform X13 n=1 Tax=Leptidea sinapis TaxID=189913 RepID=UPI00212E8A87|nr:prolyl 4-hydroxylase subunit alpha-1-like isoform X13 [Leptidea sinapis]XP_050664934.1 prolyl 4-hydroxylase subunit alpha-1-like isoform X13 [Leptidea sinapis]